MVLRSDERSPVASSKIATVERREARVPVTRHAGAFLEVPLCYEAPNLALPSLFGGRRKKEGGAPRLTISGADESRLQGGSCRHYCPEIARRVSSVTSFGV